MSRPTVAEESTTRRRGAARKAAAASAPAIYRTRITHLRRTPVHHYFEQGGYSWYVDLDELPTLPAWMRPFARFEASDHFAGPPADGREDTLRHRVDDFLAGHGIDMRGGSVTALLQARVLGYVFNPVSLYWCHDADGVLRHVVVELHNIQGERHAYLLPPTDHAPAAVKKTLPMSPFNDSDGYYLLQAPRPNGSVDVTISLHREHTPGFVATLRGNRRSASVGQVLALQFTAPMAPLMGALWMRIHDVTLWARRVPLVSRESWAPREPVGQL
ncbi:DUF1365 domain-containing protein [Mycolicibacterium lacusdiani]|uniref:DUF1365 domain-containing protein n=1 Tax=Mycolicibacterium lacusdiani TaxID=2895283 RepID=UPI001F1B94F5|nr:DUF1365 family protein [Mycolicibacterium lacusdiani]